MRLGVGVGGSTMTMQGTWGIPLYVIVQWGAVLGQAGTACILATVIWLLVMAGAGAGAWCLLNQRHNREGKHSDKTQQLDFDWGPAVAASSCPGAELSSEHPTGGCVRALCVPISYGPCQPGPGGGGGLTLLHSAPVLGPGESWAPAPAPGGGKPWPSVTRPQAAGDCSWRENLLVLQTIHRFHNHVVPVAIIIRDRQL